MKLATLFLLFAVAAGQTMWTPTLQDRFQYQLGENFLYPQHYIAGVKVLTAYG